MTVFIIYGKQTYLYYSKYDHYKIMQIYELYINLLHNPFAIRTYRALERYYLEQGMMREAHAFGQLIETRLQHDTDHNTLSSEER